jgi:cupin fold WbuC family metalloprotein
MSIEFYGDSRSNPSAIVIRRKAKVDGIEFFSPPNFGLQIGLMTREKESFVPPHIHNKVNRSIEQTQEVLIVRQGSCRIDLLTESGKLTESIKLSIGDTILLAHGAHSIEFLDDCEILEVKQGPYAFDKDKTLLDYDSSK